MSRRQEVFSLRIAHLAFRLHGMLKTDGQVYTDLVRERAGQDDFLKAYGPSEWDEAKDVLLYFQPKPLAQGVRPGLIAITDYGKEKSSADVLSDLIQQEYRMSKRPVEAASRWQSFVDMALLILVGSVILFLAIQPIYLPSGNILAAFDPWPAKLAVVLGFLSFVMALASVGERDKHWFSNEQLVASAFYESYLHYRNFITNPQAEASLKQARKLVRKAATRMQQVGKPRWEILGEDLERISEIGKNAEGLLLPAMGKHAGSAERGELLITLARCFLQKTRDSMKMALAQSLRVKAPPTELPSPSRWHGLSSYFGHSHPGATGCVTGLTAAICILLVYVAYASASHEPLVPGAAIFTSVAGTGLSVGVSTFLALRRSG